MSLFEDLPIARTGVDFQLRLPDIERHIHEIIHLSVYGGVCTGDYDGDGLADIYATSPVGGNRLFRNVGDFRFEDVTAAAGLLDTNFWGTGATFVDIDNDGDLDIYACGYLSANRLYRNEGVGADGRVRFSEQARGFGLDFKGASMTMAFADMDNDGDLDGYLATTASPPPPGVRFRVEFQGNRPVIPKELREYWALIYLPGDNAHRTEAGQADRLYRNDGGRFTEVAEQAGIDGNYFTLAALWWDFDNDGWPDLYVANDYLGPDMLYRNQRNGTFTNIVQAAIPHTPWSSMGVDIGDLNNDGLLDLIATDMLGSTHYRRNVMMGETSKTGWFLDVPEPRQYVRNALYLNTGAGRVMEAAYLAGLAATDWTWAPRIEDFDNDGRVDVFIGNGMVRDVQNADLGQHADRAFGGGSPAWAKHWAEQQMQKEANFAFRNLGDMRFESVASQWGLGRVGISLGAATADFDNDGNLDLVVNNADAPLSIYRNRGHENIGKPQTSANAFRVRLKGTASNPFGIGATVRLRAGGLEQMRYLTLARGWLSACEPTLHFGLGNAAQVDELNVHWPSGRRQSFTNLSAKQLAIITEPARSEGQSNRPSEKSTPMFVDSNVPAELRHEVAAFDDFVREPMLPRKLSQRAFCWAWADVDKDGDDDLYLGGTKGLPGRLLLNAAAGNASRPAPSISASFTGRTQAAFLVHKDSSDTAAAFLDADGDGDLDLFVVSGGVLEEPGDVVYRDRFYLNDGNGTFTIAPTGVLTDLRDSGSCVAVADFDRDGKADLFVGGGSIPGRYPMSEPSRLLRNTGGKFEDATPQTLRDIGIVTDAVWADVDTNGWPDLLATIEWGPVRLFLNDGGKLAALDAPLAVAREAIRDKGPPTGEASEIAKLSQLTGWWSAIAAGDLDHDGDVDFVVGNQGHNTKYQATEAQPEMLFYGDLDGSGQTNLLEAYFVGEFAYPHRGRDALATVSPSLTGRFKTFDQFAKVPIEDVFSMEALRRSRRLEANTFASGLLINKTSSEQLSFEFVPLPWPVQLAPARDLALADVNTDSYLDLLVAQNDFSPVRDTGRMDGGASLLLLGNGKGRFECVWPNRSGIVVPGEAARVAVVDLNGDDRPDVLFGLPSGKARAFLNVTRGAESSKR